MRAADALWRIFISRTNADKRTAGAANYYFYIIFQWIMPIKIGMPKPAMI
jgi:hypothetical protein